MLRLNSLHRMARYHAGQQRVFRHILKVAAASRLADKVGAPGQLHVEPFSKRLPPDQRAGALRHFRVEGGAQQQAGGQRGGIIAGADIAQVADAETGVALLQRGDAQARYGGIVSGGTDRLLRKRLAA